MTCRSFWNALVAVSCCAMLASHAKAQSSERPERRGIAQWVVVDAIGYGGVGLVAGVGLTFNSLGAGTIPIVAGSTLLGALGGAAMGSRARTSLINGERISGAHRAAVTFGAAVAGATLGGVASAGFINGEGSGTPFGSDEQTAAMLMGSGTVLGCLYAWRYAGDFDASRVSVAPYRTRDQRFGLQARLEY